MAVAAAMASCGCTLGSYTKLVAFETKSISKTAFFGSSYGSDPLKHHLCTSARPSRLSYSLSTMIPKASATAIEDGSYQDTDVVPTPKVVIDQDSDPNATIVEVTFGDRLGALLDTMGALKNLGLNVVKAKVHLDTSGKHNTFSITKASTGRKVEDPELLEAIRLTIISNLLEYHPVRYKFRVYAQTHRLTLSLTLLLTMRNLNSLGIKRPISHGRSLWSRSTETKGLSYLTIVELSQLDIDIATRIHIYDDSVDRSLLSVETADRPGLLVDLVKIVTDINVAVESGEFDTEGLLAKAKFHVNYKGKALIKPLQQVVANSLRYFLRRPSTEESSF
ncbi:hypothetical protein OSB04_003837 [Centaurea solstitialis]|uniref:ACT domain-containing protein ACR n=1 Tax=Centaurea solstitialis TaxID=347529 RepID=A0AA38U850_9ASTR|nr:hypothetical protein OSB04_003837 [Centaurea solstitialis]